MKREERRGAEGEGDLSAASWTEEDHHMTAVFLSNEDFNRQLAERKAKRPHTPGSAR